MFTFLQLSNLYVRANFTKIFDSAIAEDFTTHSVFMDFDVPSDPPGYSFASRPLPTRYEAKEMGKLSGMMALHPFHLLTELIVIKIDRISQSKEI